METNSIAYPSLATAKVSELLEFYNKHSGLEPLKGFKNKADAQELCAKVIAKLEGTATPECEEELEEQHESTSLDIASQIKSANTGSKKTSTKNEGVGNNVKMLLEQGLSNKEILAKIHEMYGNENTSYACVAWYRNKWKKDGGEFTQKEEALQNFAKKFGLSEEALDELKTII